MLIGFIRKVLKKSINIEHRKLIIIATVFIAISSIIMYVVEPNEFNTLFNGLWYVMTTVSQVGVGDYVPKSVAGKIYSMFMYIIGVGLFAVIIAKSVDFFNKYEELKEQEIMGFKGKDHVVIINWSKKAKITVEEIIEKDDTTEIVLIDKMDYPPMSHKQVHFVHGHPTNVDTLNRGNVLQANSVCIFATDYPFDITAEDGKSLLIAATIKHLAKQENTKPYVVTEILDENHITNTDQQVIDKFIISDRPFSKLMATTALNSK